MTIQRQTKSATLPTLFMLLVIAFTTGCGQLMSWGQQLQSNPVTFFLDLVSTIERGVHASEGAFEASAAADPEISARAPEFHAIAARILSAISIARETISTGNSLARGDILSAMAPALDAVNELRLFIASLRHESSGPGLRVSAPSPEINAALDTCNAALRAGGRAPPRPH